jgi:hypothetical protein
MKQLFKTKMPKLLKICDIFPQWKHLYDEVLNPDSIAIVLPWGLKKRCSYA